MKPSIGPVVLLALLGFAQLILASEAQQESTMNTAKGTFEVKLAPQAADNDAARKAGIARMSLDKQFSGDLQGTSSGEMLAAGDGTTSGAYVAIEKVTGTLAGRNGSFMLAHHALMNQGSSQAWMVTVIPDSGTDQLKGLSGTMKIVIEKGKHSYELTYELR
jgi:hypothetical protein